MNLYIDDDTDYGVYVTRNFPEALFTNKPAEAYELIKNNKVTEVYLDMHIPEINTADFARKLKKTFPEVTLYINSTLELSEAELKAVQQVADGFIQK